LHGPLRNAGTDASRRTNANLNPERACVWLRQARELIWGLPATGNTTRQDAWSESVRNQCAGRNVGRGSGTV
jgi:hypothetical protein